MRAAISKLFPTGVLNRVAMNLIGEGQPETPDNTTQSCIVRVYPLRTRSGFISKTRQSLSPKDTVDNPMPDT